MKKNGWRYLGVVPLLALLGCNGQGEVIDFGLSIQYQTDEGLKGASCSRGGDALDGEMLRMDYTEALPDLFVETVVDRENDTYAVRFFEVSEYKPNSKEPAAKKILAERTYDKPFGDQSGKEQLHIDSAGVGYDIDVEGLPLDSVVGCPPPDSD